MRFEIRLENTNDFYRLMGMLLTHPVSSCCVSETTEPPFADIEELFEWGGVDFGHLSKCFYDKDGSLLHAMLRLVPFDIEPDYPCLAVGNFSKVFDRMSDVTIQHLDFINLYGTHTLDGLDNLKEIQESDEYLEAANNMDELSALRRKHEGALPAENLQELWKSVSEYKRINNQIMKLIIGDLVE